jgi:trehalose 6-phosphate synthase/phosphatase
MSRLLIVSNRLPLTARVEQGAVALMRSAGGLATALRGPHEKLDSLWIGWPGDVSRMSDEQRRRVDEELAEARTVPVHLSAQQIARYYDGFSNGVLWPLFHYLVDKVQLDARRDFQVYTEVNELFANKVLEQYRDGDSIWVHDYQLALVPQMLRERIPNARIGFFLHIPFPSSEVFRVLPWREQLLRGLLGADLLGFHTASFRHNFAYSAARVLGVEPDFDVVQHEGRAVRLGVYPISIDVDEFEQLASSETVRAESERIRSDPRALILGVDRFDYTKGIPRRLLGFERLLERSGEHRKRLRFVQIAVPTREKIDAYAELRRTTNELVGRINGQYGGVAGVPIHFLHRAIQREKLVSLYRAADVMLVTPLRDGMNLVAKEFVASRVDDDGVLVLSEFAGAADELTQALLVNPYDLDAIASSIQHALAMSPRERRARMRGMRSHVRAHDVHAWARSFLDELGEELPRVPSRVSVTPSNDVVERIRAASPLVLLLDYDGTLVEHAPTPEMARPDEELLELLERLTHRAEVHIVSGRLREDMETFFGSLPVALHAEHGFWHRRSGGEWAAVRSDDFAWRPRARAIMKATAMRTRGAFVEEKTASLAFHYRRVDPELASARLHELRYALDELVRTHHLELLTGSKVLELRIAGVDKSLAVQRVSSGLIVAIGDDRTDEDLFAALPEDAIAIHVGRGQTRAGYRLKSTHEVRTMLQSLVS